MAREEYNLPLNESLPPFNPKGGRQYHGQTPLSHPAGALYTIELDVFLEPFTPLIIAEVEFPGRRGQRLYSSRLVFFEDVTCNPAYHNSTLSSIPAETNSREALKKYEERQKTTVEEILNKAKRILLIATVLLASATAAVMIYFSGSSLPVIVSLFLFMVFLKLTDHVYVENGWDGKPGSRLPRWRKQGREWTELFGGMEAPPTLIICDNEHKIKTALAATMIP